MTCLIVLFPVAGVEAPNEEVRLLLETHSEVDGGMCTSVVTINTCTAAITGPVHAHYATCRLAAHKYVNY